MNEHLFNYKRTAKEALVQLNLLASDSILFVVDDEGNLIGSLTDGDIRRGLISNLSIEENVLKFVQKDPKYLRKGCFEISYLIELRNKNFRIIPILDKNSDKILRVLNFRTLKSYLPIDVVIMAGGKGERLKPLTLSTPKPLIKVGEKPIIKHNIDNISSYGVEDFFVSVNYLGDQIENFLKPLSSKCLNLKCIWESKPLGTIGSITLVKEFQHDYILLTNSDILTNLDYENFFLDFIKNKADFSVLTIPYDMTVPYAVLETDNNKILSLKEKPTFTYFSNGGIYLFKKELIKLIPVNTFFNTTDLIEILISADKKVISYPYKGYWLDIGRHEDLDRANRDLEYINF
jgi:dTDP-glucose pyrophosphorylase